MMERVTRAELAERRASLSLWTHPVQTLSLFARVMGEYVRAGLVYVLTHRVTLLVGIPLLVALAVLPLVPGAHVPYVRQVHTWLYDIFFWVGLGVLSSVGLGTGMHSGVLFLFPHIARVCMAASDDASFVDLFSSVFWPCFLWGSGTAIGEIPPYWISRTARLAGDAEAAVEKDQERKLHEHDSEPVPPEADFNVASQMTDWARRWTFEMLDRYGFWAILAFSAWPNMAFDLCGIGAGHFLIPFTTFFSAVWIGKALIKVNGQAAFFITIFRRKYIERILTYVDQWGLHAAAEAARKLVDRQHERFASGEVQDAPETPLIAKLWNVFMICFIGWFVVSVIESLARGKQAEIDEARLAASEKTQ